MFTTTKGPYLQWPTENSMTFMWETSEQAVSKVEVYIAERIHSGHQGNYRTPDHLWSTSHSKISSTIHQLTIGNLEAATTYFYKIYSENALGELLEAGPYSFKTAVQKGAPFSFTVTSETGGYAEFDQTYGRINASIFNQMHRYRPDMTLFIGDIVNDGRNAEDWEKYFFGPGQEFLAVTPSYCCLGNHELNASWYYDYFAFPPPKNDYSFDYGDVHFISLDSIDFIKDESYPHTSGEMNPGNAQYDFLIQDLEASSAKWKIVFFHYPPYISGGYQVEDLRQLSPIFERYDVDVVFNSHTIVYERSHPLRSNQIDFKDGIVYIVAGGAGSIPEWQLPKREWHTSQALAVPHFVQVVVVSDDLEIRAIDDEGRLFDMLKIRKGLDGTKTFL